MRSYLALASLLLVGACATFGAPPSTLAADCSAQAAKVQEAAVLVRKITAAERATVDSQIALSRPYCGGSPVADQVTASSEVRKATARIDAVVTVANSRS
jgi:hypothetical protein